MRTLLEFMAVILMIIGFINEKKIVAFEWEILFPYIKKLFKIDT